MRTLVIGDIHSALKALKQCLKRSEYDYTKDKLIFLGDYVDGWSRAAELIQYLIKLQKKSKEKIIFLRGNHDVWCEKWLFFGNAPIIWTQQGGQATIDSYIKTGFLTNFKHKKFFRQLHNYYKDDKNRVFVHGGFISRKGIGHDAYISDYYWDRDLWGLALMSNGKTDEISKVGNYRRFEKHKEIYIGHTSTTNWKCKPHYSEYYTKEQIHKNGKITVPMNRCNVWNMDTGAGFDGKLTIMDIDTKQFWQSDFVKELYKNENGR